MVMLSNDVKSELLFHIENSLEQEVDSKQLLNQVTETNEGYELRAYGKTLRFNKDGDLL